MAELPQNWILANLNELCTITTGKKDVNAAKENGEYKFFTCAMEPLRINTYIIDDEAIILPGNGANVGMVLYYNGKFDAYQRTYVLYKNKINTKYLYYYLKCYWATYNKDKQYGSATNYIRLGNLTNFRVKVPPLNEQKRIVEKLDKMMRIVDGVNARLDKIPTALKRARQSILNQAITGELTKDWREKNAYSSAKELILKLEIEKNNIYAKECEIAKSNETKKPQKPKYFRIANNVLDINIPNQWSFINLSQTIYDFKYGTSTKSDYSYKGIPVIRIPNISNMKLSFDDLKYLNLSDIDNSNKIKKDDILIVRSNGSRDLVGKNALVKELDKEYAFASYLIRMRPLINNPEYLILLLNTDAIKEQFFSKAKSSAGINNINTEELATTIIPLPPLEEQAEIVRRVKLAFEKLDKIELRYQKAKEYFDKLAQSILNKAFRGELVPQDPNDKPISLDDIQVQIAEKPSKKRKTLKNNKVQEMAKEIIEILKEYPEGISPEELFKNSKYSQKDFTDDDIIEFYKELSNLLDLKLTEEKDSVNHKILIKKVK